MDAIKGLTRLGGVASHAELVAALGRKELRLAVGAGDVRRVGQGVYALPQADRDDIAVKRLSGALGLTSAALAHGWKVRVPPDRPMIWVPRHRKVSPARREGVDLRWGDVTALELETGVTTRIRTVIDCARFLPFDDAVAVADSALRSETVTPETLLAAAEASPRTRRKQALAVVAAADGRAANPLETGLRTICRRIPGLDVEPQVMVGDIGRADLVDRGRRLVIEAESMEHHGTRTKYRRDVRRYTAMVGARHLVLRFCWEDVMFAADDVQASIESVLSWWPPAERLAVEPPAA